MAFPTTDMSGYVELRQRISSALGRCQEQPWLDFKESQEWEVLKWRLIKTCMGMANLRDGGLIIVGVAERDTTWELTGIKPSDLLSFDQDVIVDVIHKFASPNVRLDIVLHEHDGNRYLAINVHQFRNSPVVCRNNSPHTVGDKHRLASGDIYVRPSTGRPKTVRVTDAEMLHDLLELAAEFRARNLLGVANRVGLVPGESAASRYDDELRDIFSS